MYTKHRNTVCLNYYSVISQKTRHFNNVTDHWNEIPLRGQDERINTVVRANSKLENILKICFLSIGLSLQSVYILAVPTLTASQNKVGSFLPCWTDGQTFSSLTFLVAPSQEWSDSVGHYGIHLSFRLWSLSNIFQFLTFRQISKISKPKLVSGHSQQRWFLDPKTSFVTFSYYKHSFFILHRNWKIQFSLWSHK